MVAHNIHIIKERLKKHCMLIGCVECLILTSNRSLSQKDYDLYNFVPYSFSGVSYLVAVKIDFHLDCLQ